MDTEGPADNGDEPKTASSVLFFGPQTRHLTERSLLKLRNSILGNTDLDLLVDAVRELPSLWPTLIEGFSPLSRVSGTKQLYQLSQLIDTGTIPKITALNNILLAPLTVLSHIVAFLRLNEDSETAAFPAIGQETSGLVNVQGFCVGFLVAAAVASSRDKTEFLRHSVVALRLAVCVGAAVDLDEATICNSLDRSASFAVHWKTELEHNHFESTLSSYTSVSHLRCSYTQVLELSIYTNNLHLLVFARMRFARNAFCKVISFVIGTCSCAARSFSSQSNHHPIEILFDY